jgi:cytochrome c oxidase cbb3-type subunit 3
MMNDKPDPPIAEPPIDVADLRPHVFDGIQEYDKHMPNWWLWTFYLAIIFSIGYWVIVHMLHVGDDPGQAVEAQLRAARETALKNAPELSNAKLWAMSRDASMTAAGKATFETACASCHRPDLGGQIGPNLKDQEWVHGGQPMDLVKIINEGFLAKGMPPWAQMLGQKKVSEVVAYILSFHEEGEPVTIKPWVPVLGAAPAPAAAN